MLNKSIILRNQNNLIKRSIMRLRLKGLYKKCPICNKKVTNRVEPLEKTN